MRVPLLTLLAILAFAANSILCRLALGDESIDAASFAALRLGSGTVVLLVLLGLRGQRPAGGWLPGLALFLYMVPFSFAYVSLSAGTGALILFGAVQATMILSALQAGERLHGKEWCGLLIACGGLVYLVWPGVRAPSPAGSGLMAVAGVAWGIYSLRGRLAEAPMAATAGSFLRALPFALIVSLLCLRAAHLTLRGASLAVLSGAVTSGLGYVIWYAAIAGLTATRAATAQLAVPALTTMGGVALLGEPLTVRLVLASVLILGGVALAMTHRPSGGAGS